VTSERAFQSAVMEMARLRGWSAWHMHDSRRQIRPGVFVGDRDASGVPDLLLAHERYGVVFAELKSDTGRLRDSQRTALYALQRAGARVYVWRPGDMTEIARVFAGHAVAAPLLAAPLRRGGAATTQTTDRRTA